MGLSLLPVDIPGLLVVRIVENTHCQQAVSAGPPVDKRARRLKAKVYGLEFVSLYVRFRMLLG